MAQGGYPWRWCAGMRVMSVLKIARGMEGVRRGIAPEG